MIINIINNTVYKQHDHKHYKQHDHQHYKQHNHKHYKAIPGNHLRYSTSRNYCLQIVYFVRRSYYLWVFVHSLNVRVTLETMFMYRVPLVMIRPRGHYSLGANLNII